MEESSSSSKISVLFVCLGNICRSTMAEGVFRSLASSHPRIGTIDSCGTSGYNLQQPPDSRTMETLARHGITDYDHRGRKLRVQDLEDFDYLFAMDKDNLYDLEKMASKLKGQKKVGKVLLFGEYNGKKKAEVVVDPYYGADNGFDEVYEQVVKFSKEFIKRELDERQ